MKKRLLTAWIIACMFICLVGQTPITALAEGDDTRVISVPEGLQEVLINETPEVQTVETEDTTEDTNVVQTEGTEETNEVQDEQGENVSAETPDVQTQEDTNEPLTEVTEETNEVQDEQSENGTVETSDVQTQDETTSETPDIQTEQEETVVEETPESIGKVQQVTETNLTASIVASDGNTYETNVTYTSESGIPMEGTVLQVTELISDDEGYDEYLEESASKVGVDTENIVFSKVFDIKIVDENDENIEYEPTGNVDVSIRVVGVSLNEFAKVNVLHFVEDKNDENYLVYDVETTVNEETVEFSTDSFSVYVVIGQENGIVENPRVMFHFISYDSNGSTGQLDSENNLYYIGEPYQFKNIKNEVQTTQILKNGESLELIADPGNLTDKNFFGWYVVSPKIISETDEYGIGKTNQKPYYIWPSMPEAITFESPISITESGINIGDTVHWNINNVSGEGKVDADGNVHVFLAPVYENYHFVNFMLYARDDTVAASNGTGNNLMTRRLIALGSAQNVDVKISDIRSNSTDAVHLIFTGWEYLSEGYDTPDDTTDDIWVQIHTVDYSGAEMKDEGRDGTYLTGVNMENRDNIDLYPIFVEARWVDFFSGISGSGAQFVGSRFLKSWGQATPLGTEEKDNENFFRYIPVSARPGYAFDGWYAFAVIDEETGEITNLYDDTKPNNNAKPVKITYLKYGTGNSYTEETVTVTTTAIKITNDNASGNIVFDGNCGLVDNGDGTGSLVFDGSGNILFSASDGKLKFHDPLDRLMLYAKWESSNARVTLVYWTEDAQDQGYWNSPHEKVEDIYSANQAVTYSTADLLQLYQNKHGSNPDDPTKFSSGYTLTYNDLLDLGLLSAEKLAGAVPSGEEKFYETVNKSTVIGKDNDGNDVNPDSEVTIKGDGSTIFNVYLNRMTFKLVFHIGHDGYVKNAGQQKADAYPNWDGNWIEYMYKDDAVTALGYSGKGQPSYVGNFSMTYNGGTPNDSSDDVTATSGYVTSNFNVMGNYEPIAGEDLYIIEAKYGAYIGDRWPSPTNPNFSFEVETDSSKTGYNKSLYIWTAYYGSLYAGIANSRPTQTSSGTNSNGNNSDINGVYEYMSAELCSNRDGTDIINGNHVHHMVAYFGNLKNSNAGQRFKQYHILVEAIDGTIYDPNVVSTTSGNYYSQYTATTWSTDHSADVSIIENKEYHELRSEPVISNLEPWYQLGWDLDGYNLVYSCYDPVQHQDPNISGQKNYDIYFFYQPKQYELTFMFEDVSKRHSDLYDYTMSLADAKNYSGYEDPVKEGYSFVGWYTNEAGAGEAFDFSTETMPSHGVVLYPVFDKLSYVIKIDPNGGVIDRWHSGSSSSGASTGFRADYHETISAYNFLERNYLPTDAEEIARIIQNDPDFDQGTDIYYYMNAQYIDGRDGRFIPSRLRNALYLNASQIEEYWNFYNSFDENQFTERGAIKFTDKNEWMDAYFGGHDLTSLQKYRYKRGNEKYSFMGWYQLFDDETLDSAPFDFNTQVNSDITIQAQWRLDGGYYLKYNPQFYYDDGVIQKLINGEVEQWNDPADPTKQKYVDRSTTSILNAPTNVTSGYVFRGWRVVRANGKIPGTTYTNWEPIQFDSKGEPIYYQPGSSFRIDSELASQINASGSIIHIQAYYEAEESSSRRPKISNLIIDANSNYGGFYTIDNSDFLPALKGPGNRSFNPDPPNKDDQGKFTQVLLGDFQSNESIHLNQYANILDNHNGYLLLGFDEGKDETVAYDETSSTNGLRSGSPFIPTFATDSVLAVTRDDQRTLYAIWEPMIYVIFVNETGDPIDVNLSAPGNIINEVKGIDRSSLSINSNTTITVPANSRVKVVLPDSNAGDEFTATVTNNHTGKLMSVSGVDPNGNPHGIGHNDIPETYQVIYSGELVPDVDGIVVTYTETNQPKSRVFFDLNVDKGGITTWTEQNNDYADLTGNGELYSITKEAIANNHFGQYKPSDPISVDNLGHLDKIFIGWTDNADIAAHTDFSSTTKVTWGQTEITPDENSNVLEKIKSEHLWDFSQTLPPDGDLTLYAVWSDKVTVTFDIVYSPDEENANTLNNHNWGGPLLGSTEKSEEFCSLDSLGRYITYSLAKGDKVPKPNDPTCYEENSTNGWYFHSWLTLDVNTIDQYRYTAVDPNGNQNTVKAILQTFNDHAFKFNQPVTNNVKLVTSWMKSQPQTFVFTVRNEVLNGSPDEEFTYTIKVENEMVDKGGWNQVTTPWKPVTMTLKNNETYTIRVKVQTIKPSSWQNPGYGVTLDVIDSNGNIVKSDSLLKKSNLTIKYYTSTYQYDLIITQTAKDGYETTARIDSNPNNVACEADDTDGFLFSVREGSHFSSAQKQNVYVPDDPNNPNIVSIVFTNTGEAVVAPTSYTTNYKPFFMMFGFGAILVGLIVPPVIMFRRRREEEE